MIELSARGVTFNDGILIAPNPINSIFALLLSVIWSGAVNSPATAMTNLSVSGASSNVILDCMFAANIAPFLIVPKAVHVLGACVKRAGVAFAKLLQLPGGIAASLLQLGWGKFKGLAGSVRTRKDDHDCVPSKSKNGEDDVDPLLASCVAVRMGGIRSSM